MGKSRKSSTHNISVKTDINETKQSKNAFNLLLADLIFLFHCIVILFVLFAPFTNIPAILILHIVFALSLMVHWNANSNVCSLSIMEAHLRGLDSREHTFTHQFIAPVYDISATEWSNIVWCITVIVMGISIYKLYNTEKFKIAWQCFNELESSNNMGDRIFNMINCFKPLFIME
jgi:hypothetical protein